MKISNDDCDDFYSNPVLSNNNRVKKYYGTVLELILTNDSINRVREHKERKVLVCSSTYATYQ